VVLCVSAGTHHITSLGNQSESDCVSCLCHQPRNTWHSSGAWHPWPSTLRTPHAQPQHTHTGNTRDHEPQASDTTCIAPTTRHQATNGSAHRTVRTREGRFRTAENVGSGPGTRGCWALAELLSLIFPRSSSPALLRAAHAHARTPEHARHGWRPRRALVQQCAPAAFGSALVGITVTGRSCESTPQHQRLRSHQHKRSQHQAATEQRARRQCTLRLHTTPCSAHVPPNNSEKARAASQPPHTPQQQTTQLRQVELILSFVASGAPAYGASDRDNKL
jgi:hypothetical protein